MIILTIINTLVILYLLFKNSKFYIAISKDETFSNRTLVGYRITLWRRINESSACGIYSIYIPLKNKKKVELKEDIERLLNKNNPNVKYTLNAKFSWLKTWEEVKQFQKDYSVVDKEFVDKLVAGFKVKTEPENDICKCDKRDIGIAEDQNGKYCMHCGYNI